MPQSDGINRLKRMEFVFKGNTYSFNINPEEYTQEEPSRSTVTQTKGGAWVDDFGAGLLAISIKGTTGFNKGKGFEKWKELRDLLRSYYQKRTSESDELLFHNFTDEESWVVHPDPSGFRLLRSKSNPLLYMYDIRLICLRPATQPKVQTTNGVRMSLGSPITTPNITDEVQGTSMDAAKAFLDYHFPDPAPQSLRTQITTLQPLSGGFVPSAPNEPASTDWGESFEPMISEAANVYLDDIQRSFFPSIGTRYLPNDSLTIQASDVIERTSLSQDFQIALLMVILEIQTILRLYKYSLDSFPKIYSEADIDRTIRNTRWLTDALIQADQDIELIENIRWLSRSLDTIRSALYGGG